MDLCRFFIIFFLISASSSFVFSLFFGFTLLFQLSLDLSFLIMLCFLVINMSARLEFVLCSLAGIIIGSSILCFFSSWKALKLNSPPFDEIEEIGLSHDSRILQVGLWRDVSCEDNRSTLIVPFLQY